MHEKKIKGAGRSGGSARFSRHSWATQPMRVVLTALAVILFWTIPLSAGPASAHTYLLSADPTDGTTVGTTPGRIRLDFTDQVVLETASATVSVSDGPAYGALTDLEGQSLIVRVPPGAASSQPAGSATWEIAYRVTASDGHPVNGSLSFTVAPDSGGTGGSATPEINAGTSVDSGAWASEPRPRRIPGWAPPALGLLTAVAALGMVAVIRRQARRA